MWYYSPTKNKLIYQVRANTYEVWLSGQYGKYNSNIFLFHPMGPFPLPLNSLFWSPPTTVHRFDAWHMAVPGLYISWDGLSIQRIVMSSFRRELSVSSSWGVRTQSDTTCALGSTNAYSSEKSSSSSVQYVYIWTLNKNSLKNFI